MERLRTVFGEWSRLPDSEAVPVAERINAVVYHRGIAPIVGRR